MFLFVILYFVALNANFLGLFGAIPSLQVLENPKNEVASEIYTADNVLMGKYYRQNRTPVDYEELSPYLINALVATEDIRFEEHSGVDLRGISRAIFKTIIGGDRSSGGGSTITQQLAKNLFRTRAKESKGVLTEFPLIGIIIIKTKEWLTAVKIEQQYTKKEIITMYFNTVEFGSNAYGIHTAARTFFNKEPSQLNIQESATLVGLLKAPTRYSPISNYENSIQRRNIVLSQMEKYGYIDRGQLKVLGNKPIVLQYGTTESVSGIAPYFRVEARKYLQDWADKNGYDLYADGLRIYTTIDSRMQAMAEDAVEQHMIKFQRLFFQHWAGRNPWVDKYNRELPNFIENEAKKSARYIALKDKYGDDEEQIIKVMNTPVPTRIFTWANENRFIDTTMSPMDSIRYHKQFLHAGFMAMDPRSGHVKAWVGGTNFQFFQYDHVKQGTRQPGSTFKPIVYVTAIDNGYTPCSKFQDIPVKFGGAGGAWTARNSFGSYTGAWLTLRQALGASVNSVAAGITKKVGIPNIIAYARDFGITTPIDPVPTICLGSADASVYEMVGAYATFANKGLYTRPEIITRIEDKDGNVIAEFIPETRRVIEEETAYLMLHMLKAALENGGTSTALHGYGVTNRNDIGAKTGTTQNNSDAWFMGVTQNLVAGLWVGGDNRSIRFRTIALGQGAVLALPVWGIFMNKVYDSDAMKELGYTRQAFEKPERMEVELDCNRMGTGYEVIRVD